MEEDSDPIRLGQHTRRFGPSKRRIRSELFSTVENEMPVSFNVTYSEEELAQIIDFGPFYFYKKKKKIFVIEDGNKNLDDIKK